MKTLIEIHLLQNFAPSNLNRDDTGAPKDAIFGGTRRARISSQCQKRAVREFFNSKVELGVISSDDLAVRTKRLHLALIDELKALGREAGEAEHKVKTALAWLQLPVDDKNDKSQYLLFVGRREVSGIARLIDENWDAINTQPTEQGEKKSSKKDATKAADSRIVKEIINAFNGGKAIDLALFGRMLADLPEKNTDAACQVAHAISTHAVEREFDFYTAIDDLKPDDTSGADMMGTVEFNSACLYRYAVINWDKLVENLQEDGILAKKGLRQFIEAFVVSEPSGKQNSFAAHNPPEFVMVSIVSNGQPMSLLNAFEGTISHRNGITKASAEALVGKAKALKDAYSRNSHEIIMDMTGINDSSFGVRRDRLEELLDNVIAYVG